jgi:hypothetical protein
MPDKGHRVYGTTTVRVSLVIHAPSRYVYDWCTDYRSDDGRFSNARPRPSFRVIRISPHRVLRIRVSRGSGRDPRIAVDLVRLNPRAPGTSTRSTRPTGRPWTTGSAPSAARGRDFSCWSPNAGSLRNFRPAKHSARRSRGRGPDLPSRSRRTIAPDAPPGAREQSDRQT